MIADKFVDLYARNSGLRDKLVAERDVVLTYALRALHETGLLEHLAFKGGTFRAGLGRDARRSNGEWHSTTRCGETIFKRNSWYASRAHGGT